MKILYFNAYNGKGDEQAYFKLLTDSAVDCDVLCLQEIDSVADEHKNPFGNMLNHRPKTVAALESSHYVYFATRQSTWTLAGYEQSESDWGMMIAVRKSIAIVEYREKYILHSRNAGTKPDLTDLPVMVQAIKIKRDNDDYMWVLNFHGYYAGGYVDGKTVGKQDTPERVDQAWKLAQFIIELQEDCPVIVGGDFNVDPDTLLIQKLTELGMHNLIAQYCVPTTRTTIYNAEKKAKWPYADYVFVDPRLIVSSFDVDADSTASDHAPILLELSV